MYECDWLYLEISSEDARPDYDADDEMHALLLEQQESEDAAWSWTH